MLRGISEDVAFINSFSDVYIKPRCGADFTSNHLSLSEMKNTMLSALKTKLEDFEDSCVDPKDTTHTMTIRGIQKNCSLEIAKQIAFTAVQESLVLDSKIEDNYNHVLFAVFNAYQRSSKRLLSLCYNIIKNSLNEQYSNKMNVFGLKLNECAHAFLLDKICDSYKRFYPEIHFLIRDKLKKANCETILLLNALLKSFQEATVMKNGFSVLDYSNAILSGSLTDDFIEYPILKHCQNYLDTIEYHIFRAIDSAKNLDDTDVCKILQLLHWRSRFLKLASENMFVTSGARKRQHLREELVPLLYIHSKWLHKHLMTPLFSLSTDKIQEMEFYAYVDRINNENDVDNSETIKISKKLRKLCGQPKLYVNKEEYELCLKKTEIYNKLNLNLNQPVKKQVEILAVDISTVTDYSLALDVPESDKFTIIEENMSKTRPLVTPALISEIKLLPLTSYVIQRLINIMKFEILMFVTKLTSEGNENVNENYRNLLLNLTQLIKLSKGFPAAFTNILEVLLKLMEGATNMER